MTKEQLMSMNSNQEEFVRMVNRVVEWFEKIDPTKGIVDDYYYIDETDTVLVTGIYVMYSTDNIELEYEFAANLLFLSDEELEEYFSKHKDEILNDRDKTLSNAIKEHIENLKEETKRLEEEYKIYK